MSSIEERLARDIEAVTQGVIVTESDLRDARETLDQRITDKQSSRRRTLLAAAAAAVVIPVVGAVAFQSLGDNDDAAPAVPPKVEDPLQSFLTGADPTVERVEGLWRLDNDTRLVLFRANGTVRFENEGQVYSDPNTVGTYELDGDRITVTITQSDQAGCVGQVMELRGALPSADAMHVAYGSGTAGPCSAVRQFEQQVLEHMLPVETAMDFGPTDSDVWIPLTQASILRGDWVAVGGGYVLEMTPGGTYVVAGGSGEVVDRGQWTLAEEQLQFVSGSDSPTCAAGDRLVLGQVAHSDAGDSEFLRGTTQQNTCNAAWTPSAWFLLPQG